MLVQILPGPDKLISSWVLVAIDEFNISVRYVSQEVQGIGGPPMRAAAWTAASSSFLLSENLYASEMRDQALPGVTEGLRLVKGTGWDQFRDGTLDRC